jgi:ABC-type thiamine transport system ATPase subunit
VQGGYTLSANLRDEAGKVTAVIGAHPALAGSRRAGIAGFETRDRSLSVAGTVRYHLFTKRPVSMLFQDNNRAAWFANSALALRPRLDRRATLQNQLKICWPWRGREQRHTKPAALSE